MPALSTVDRPMKVKEVAEHCQVSEKAVYNAIARGELGHVRIGRTIRVRPDQLDAFLNRPEP